MTLRKEDDVIFKLKTTELSLKWRTEEIISGETKSNNYIPGDVDCFRMKDEIKLLKWMLNKEDKDPKTL